MIESIMYVGIGFLLAALIGVTVIPLVHKRAVRLTIRRLEDSIPQSLAEIHADKDALRAEFAMSTRRIELKVEQLQNRTASQLAQVGKKDDAIRRLKIEREAQKVEVVALKTEVNALKERLTAASKEAEAAEALRHERDIGSIVPGVWQAAEPIQASMNFLQNSPLDGRRHEGGLSTLVPIEIPSAEVVELSIDASPRTSGYHSRVARFFIAALVGVGATVAWQFHSDKTKETARTLVSLLSAPTAKTSIDADPAAKQPDSAPAGKVSTQDPSPPQPAPVPQTAPTPDAAVASTGPGVEQLGVKQEQASDDMAIAPAVEADTKPSSALQNGTQVTAQPETRPATIEGWTLREVANGTAVLEGPAGIWRASPGDTVPGVGRIESYIRSNGRWIVATSSGLISMPIRQSTSFPLQDGTQLTAPPEMKPTGIAGWTLREVSDGTAVLRGPNGLWKVTRGDTVPELGRVDSIVRWGDRWIVATSRGYCKSAPLPAVEDGICQPYRGY